MTHSHVLVLVQAVLLGGRSVVDASRGLPKAKASYWRTAFCFALDEIAALAGFTTDRPRRPPVPERYALQAAGMVAIVGKGHALSPVVDLWHQRHHVESGDKQDVAVCRCGFQQYALLVRQTLASGPQARGPPGMTPGMTPNR